MYSLGLQVRRLIVWRSTNTLKKKIEEHPGQLLRAAVELAKGWRTDKHLRTLSAVMIATDKNISLTITGDGDVIEPEDGVIAIGSGGMFALSCARGLINKTDLDAEAIALQSMKVAADLCVFTNHTFVMEKLDCNPR